MIYFMWKQQLADTQKKIQYGNYKSNKDARMRPQHVNCIQKEQKMSPE